MPSSRSRIDLKSHLAGACFTWLLTSLFYSFQFFLRSSPNAMGNALMEDFGINVEQLGWFSAMYYIPYSLLQVPLGVSLDVWGPKRILRVGTVICVLGGVIFSLAPTFNIALLGRMMIGMGAAASFIGSIRMTTLWFSPLYLAFSIGLLSALGKLGGALANKTLPQLMASGLSWPWVIGVLCLVGSVLTLLIWIFLKNGPKDNFKGVSEVPSWALIRREILSVMAKPTVWMMGLYGYSMYLVLSVFSDTYSINFLSSSLSISREEAGGLSSWAPMGSAVGASIISFLSDHFKRRRLFLRLCSCITLAISSMIFFGPPVSPGVMRLLLLGLGVASSGQILIFAIVTESFSSKLTGIATGVTNALLMLGGALHNPLVGWLLTWNSKGTGTLAKGEFYSLSDYRLAFSSLTLCFVVASVISFFVKETHPSRNPVPSEPVL